MKNRFWVKIRCSILDDAKIGQLPDHLWRLYFGLELVAAEKNQDGELPPVSQLSWRLRLTEEKLKEDLEELEKIGLISKLELDLYFLNDFAERQEPFSAVEKMRESRKRYQPVTKSNNNSYSENSDSIVISTSISNSNSDSDFNNNNIYL